MYKPRGKTPRPKLMVSFVSNDRQRKYRHVILLLEKDVETEEDHNRHIALMIFLVASTDVEQGIFGSGCFLQQRRLKREVVVDDSRTIEPRKKYFSIELATLISM